ncbi:hypothetical protein HC554_25420, partial [Escherichia coli]|nr:hypothetical protein [Escherichia coli]
GKTALAYYNVRFLTDYFQHQPIGLAKRIGSRLKNSYPRELVRDGKLFTGNA